INGGSCQPGHPHHPAAHLPALHPPYRGEEGDLRWIFVGGGLSPPLRKSIHNGVLSRYQRDGGRRSASSPLSGSNGPMRSASSARTSLARRSDGRFAMKTTLLRRFLQG